MPGSVIAELILQPLAEITLQLAGYITARILVPAVTLGYCRVEPIGFRKTVYPRLRRPMLSRKDPLIMDCEVASLLGLVFWGLVAVGIYLYTGAR